jgi:predicted PurR-regulated permease PerM
MRQRARPASADAAIDRPEPDREPRNVAKPATESRPEVRAFGFVALALFGVALCVFVAFPLLAPILWAMVLAIVAHPLYRWTESRLGRPAVAAAAVTAVVALLVALPIAWVATELVLEASEVIEKLQSGELSRRWQEALSRHPQAAAWLDAFGRRVDLKALVGEWSGGAGKLLRGLLAGSVATATGWLIMIFILFFFLRDRERVLATVERYLPLSPKEIQEVYKVTADTVHATVYGTVGVALVQGACGALLFWWLGLPAPLLWGAVMGVLSVLPVLGAALVWGPVAGYLALQGQWGDALLLAGFGAIVIGLVDNLIYPLIVKDRIRLHAVPVFVAVIGGLVAFGASGVILGPLFLAVTDALVKLWRRRMAVGEGSR